VFRKPQTRFIASVVLKRGIQIRCRLMNAAKAG